jgi:hypothetical protein
MARFNGLAVPVSEEAGKNIGNSRPDSRPAF